MRTLQPDGVDLVVGPAANDAPPEGITGEDIRLKVRDILRRKRARHRLGRRAEEYRPPTSIAISPRTAPRTPSSTHPPDAAPSRLRNRFVRFDHGCFQYVYAPFKPSSSPLFQKNTAVRRGRCAGSAR